VSRQNIDLTCRCSGYSFLASCQPTTVDFAPSVPLTVFPPWPRGGVVNLGGCGFTRTPGQQRNVSRCGYPFCARHEAVSHGRIRPTFDILEVY